MSRFGVQVARKYRVLQKRGHAMAGEHYPPHGQAALWYEDMIRSMPPSAVHVGRQLARLCGDDSQVSLSYRSIADAVGVRDRSGRTRAYTERGIQALVEGGWLRVETVGQKRGAKTTFFLMPKEMS